MRAQPIIIFLLIGMAIILAIGLFLVILLVQGRPVVPEGTEIRLVEGEEIRIRPDPALEVVIVQPPIGVEPPVVVEPTPVVVEPLPVETPVVVEVPMDTPPPPAPQPLAPAPEPAPNSVIFIDYVVQPGDTLYSISRRMDTSIALMARYNISQKELVVGNTIRLPIGNPAFCPGRRPYAVVEGDTAFRIARRHGISVEDLRVINNLDANYTVYTATIICVP